MEPISLPVSVAVVILVASGILFFVNDKLMEGIAVKPAGQEVRPFSTQCERLVIQYLLNEKDTFERLMIAVEKFAGVRALETLLDSINGFLNYDSTYRLDRAYALRGIALMRAGRLDEAEISYSSSLLLNNHNHDARRGLINIYINSGRLDKALLEVDGVLRIMGNKPGREHYLAARKKICDLREKGYGRNDKVRSISGLASLPGYALATGHPKARSGA
jgi:tetratricopeptide (TPR) repeat protein